MTEQPIAIIRVTGLQQQQSTAIIFNNIKGARKYFSYILRDSHGYAMDRAQQETSALEIGVTFTVNDSTYWLSEVHDTRIL